MKKFFLVTGIVFASAINVTYANYTVESIENQFASDFPHASNISFEKTKDFEKVNFNQDGSQMTAYYDFDNQLAGTTINKSFHDLPAVAQIKILDKYRDYTVKDVLEFKVNSDNESYYDNDTYMTLYGNSFDKSNNYFVELKSDNNTIVLEVNLTGEVSYFTTIK